MSKKKDSSFIFNIIFFLIIASYLLMLYVSPSEIAFCNSATVFVRSTANVFLMILGIFFFIINTAVFLDLLKKKIFKISNLSGKQQAVMKKHPKKMHMDLIIGIILYFVISNFIIFYASFDTLFSRYALTKYEISYYNFLGQKVQSYGLDTFDRFEIGTQVYSSRTGTSMHFCIKTTGLVNLTFMKIHNRKQALELMAELKKSYNATIDKKDIRWFQRKTGYTNWSEEDKNLFSEIFEL